MTPEIEIMQGAAAQGLIPRRRRATTIVQVADRTAMAAGAGAMACAALAAMWWRSRHGG
jgi:hypothetical protein